MPIWKEHKTKTVNTPRGQAPWLLCRYSGNALCSQSGFQDIEGGVGVPVERQGAYRAVVPTLFQCFFGDVPTTGTRLTCVCRVDSDHPTNGTFSLLRQDGTKLRPRSIGNAFSKAMIRHHPLDVEFFNSNQTELIDKFSCQLVNEIMPTVPNPLMDTRQYLVCFSAWLTAFRRAALFPCGFSKCFFVFAKKARVINERAIRESRELFQPNVNTNGIIGFSERNGFIFTGKTSEPLSSQPANCTGFRGSDKRSVNNHLHLSNFRNGQDSSRQFTPARGELRERYAIVNAAPFPARIASLLSLSNSAEKRLKREFYSFGDVLQNLTVNGFEFGEILLPSREVLILVVSRERLTLRFVYRCALDNHAVVNFAADSQRVVQQSFLRFRWIYAILYTERCHDCIIPRIHIRKQQRGFAASVAFPCRRHCGAVRGKGDAGFIQRGQGREIAISDFLDPWFSPAYPIKRRRTKKSRRLWSVGSCRLRNRRGFGRGGFCDGRGDNWLHDFDTGQLGGSGRLI